MEEQHKAWTQSWLPVVLGTLGVLVVSSALWAITQSSARTYPIKRPGKVLVLGEQVFKDTGCWYCHHPSLSGMRSGNLSNLFQNENGWVAYFYAPRSVHPRSSKSAYRWLLKTQANGRKELNEKGKALVAYIQHAVRSSFVPQKETTRVLALTPSSPDGQGLALYKNLCASCHGARGFGDGLLAGVLPTALRDLSKPKKWLCRSHRSASVSDINRTLDRQTGNCGMMRLVGSLSPKQKKSLVEVVRQLSGLDHEVQMHPALKSKTPGVPRRFLTQKRDFRDWESKMWEARYDAWLDHWRRDLGPNAYLPFRHWRDWKEWTAWKSFSLWMRENEGTLRLGQGDWHRALQRKPQMRSVFSAWLESNRKKPWSTFMRRFLRKKLRAKKEQEYKLHVRNKEREWVWFKPWQPFFYKRRWFKYELNRHRFRNFLRRHDFQSYGDWREQKERDLFRLWMTGQRGELYWAFKGQKVYAKLGCIRCHGENGEGSKLPITQYTQGKKPKVKMVIVRDLRKGAFQCGNRWEDVYRSIVVGVGEHMRGLTSLEVKRYLRGAILPAGYWARSQGKHAKRLREDLWALAAYIRFLGRNIPVQKGMWKRAH